MKKIAFALLATFLAGVGTPATTCALESHERAGWYFGLGFGPARSVVTDSENHKIWLTGTSPQIRFGKLLGDAFALGLDAQTWFGEYGTVGDDLTVQLKVRVTGHLWALAGTWYPGDPQSAWGGLFVRAGTGPAIANVAAAIPDPTEPESGQELQSRVDNWGWGVLAAVGYAARVTRHFAAGVQISGNHLWIDENVERFAFVAPTLHLIWYF